MRSKGEDARKAPDIGHGTKCAHGATSQNEGQPSAGGFAGRGSAQLAPGTPPPGSPGSAPPPPAPSPRLPGRPPASGLWAGRTPPRGVRWGRHRRQEGAGGCRAARRKGRPRASRSPPRAPAMWGLLLAAAAFAPAVGSLGLGAAGPSVLGLAPPASTEAPAATPAQRSTRARPPAGTENGPPPGPPEQNVRVRVVKKTKVVTRKRKKASRPGPSVTASPAGARGLPDEQEPGCPPLGLESLRVSDSQLEASSSQSYGLGPHRGRLNIQSGLEDGDLHDGAWCAEQQDAEPWLQVDAGRPTRFSGVITQGRNSVWRYDWVTSYKVQFSNDSRSWWGSRNRSSGLDAVFPANSDPEAPVLNLLPAPQVARFVRLLPQTWLQGGAPCLRAEVLACPVSDPNGLVPEAPRLASSDPLDFRHHDYKAMRKLMRQVNEQCPNVTRVYSIGKSHRGRKLYVMELSDQPGQHELGEPEVRYVAGMHGNEALGRELLLLLMQFLCREFLRGDPRVTRLLSETRIHLLPSMNPDGYETAHRRGSELVGWAEGRWTQQGIDLNHNFADLNTPLWEAEDDGLVPHAFPNHHLPLPAYYVLPNATVAPETRAVIRWMERIPFVLSANLHGGELVVSYPFDMTRTPWVAREPTPTPDEPVFRWLSTVYAGTNRAMQDAGRRPCHNQDFSLHGSVINGADWHTVPGSMNDFSYLHTNCFEVTVELSCDKFPHEDELPQEWENNKDALLTYLEQVRMGIAGVVRDKDTELGIADAVIAVDGINHDVTTAWGGDYWRLLTPGEYVVTASAEGYHEATRSCRVAFEEGPTRCDFRLTKTPKQRLRELLAAGAKVPPDLRRRLERLRQQKG
ncbi:probable carboxypeptidase X1 [Dasypus novemcinctus]|uniref:probable carboxypeptidase X1 n=1 Tax=Dasypus novemcinctus TaxID=9361 RepID=UPI00265F223E|nr:probable carboxypeptidase X1 [Dasypus novemcinctus]